MKLITVSPNEAGQRLDKLLAKYLREAPKSFLYRMLRKKNITLNGKKAQGGELLAAGDEIRLFFSDETLRKFQGEKRNPELFVPPQPLSILYEDAHILLVSKPAGMLSQKARPEDVSLVEYLITYLLQSGSLTPEELAGFRPSVCNRLDRNTSGIVAAGKSLAGLQAMSQLLRERAVRKYYRCVTVGELSGKGRLSGYLQKDRAANQVAVQENPADGGQAIETEYRVLAAGGGLSLLEVHLITGRSHQIRAHLASIGHPILGDPKYGDPVQNRHFRASHGVSTQLLHAFRLEFPPMEGTLAHLSGQIFCAPEPPTFRAVASWIESKGS